jgi:hypothetical protein
MPRIDPPPIQGWPEVDFRNTGRGNNLRPAFQHESLKKLEPRMTFDLKTRALSLPLSLALAGIAQADIVNINGAGDDGAGAVIYGYPVSPGTAVSLFNPVEITLGAGDYLISDAWGQDGAMYDAWNFQSTVDGSWAAHFVVAAVNDGSYTVLLDASEAGDPSCTYHFCGWLTEQQASDQFLATAPFHLHLDNTTLLAFASADYALGDNLGGMSLSITPESTDVPAVPEPGSYALMLGGLIGLCAWAYRRAGPNL